MHTDQFKNILNEQDTIIIEQPNKQSRPQETPAQRIVRIVDALSCYDLNYDEAVELALYWINWQDHEKTINLNGKPYIIKNPLEFASILMAKGY